MSTVVVPSIRGGVVEKFLPADRTTWQVTAGQAATGGRLVEGIAAGDRQCRTAQAASLIAVGVALHDAAATEKVTVAPEGGWMLRANGAINGGQRIGAAANGEVVAIAADGDPRLIVGYAFAAIGNAADGPCKLLL
jgi:hypothetical protein